MKDLIVELTVDVQDIMRELGAYRPNVATKLLARKAMLEYVIGEIVTACEEKNRAVVFAINQKHRPLPTDYCD
jgi:citrate lyase beta subunit